MLSMSLHQPGASGSATGNPRNKVALKPGHSLMDWIRLGNSGQDLSGTGGAFIDVTPAQLAEHKSPGDAWLCIRGIVYNISRYLDFHPGGVDELMRGAGMDATSLFNEVHPWVNYESILKKCIVGRLRHNIEEDLFPFSQPSKINFNKGRSEQKENNISLSNTLVSKVDWYQQLTYITFVLYLNKPCAQVVIDNRVKTEIWIGVGGIWSGWESKGDLIWPPNLSVSDTKVEVKFSKAVPFSWPKTAKLSPPHPPPVEFWSLAIESVSPVNHNVFLIALKPAERVYYHIPVGHHLTLFTDIKGIKIERSYTPVKKVIGRELKEQFIWMLVKRYSEGVFSSWLTGTKQGETVLSSPPIGSFSPSIILTTSPTHLILLAAGTGLTPMLGLIAWVLKNSKLEVSLKFFNKTEEDIIWRDSFNDLEMKNKRFRVEHILSDGSANWKGKRGWITPQMLQSFIPDFSKDVPSLHFVCICGPVSFTQLCERYLRDMGYPGNHYFSFKG